ncbi:MAG: potassium channel protein [Actinomycetota bacterium]
MFNPVRYLDDEDDPWRRVQVGLLALGAVLAAGTVAYRLVGLPWMDAFYQTVITVTTVGYGEIPPADGEIGGAYRLVTSVVVLGGVAVGAYTLGVFFEALIDGRLSAHLGKVRMQRELDHLNGHVIVCGYGQVGQAIVERLTRHGRSVVVIDQRADLEAEPTLLLVRGDATDDDVLEAAGIDRATGLVTALDTDAGNLFVTVSARTANPDLHIVSRANDPGSVTKLQAAGADRVVNPHEIGGTRMASFIVQPNVADFLGESMVDGNLQVRLTETEVKPGDRLADRSIDESGVARDCGIVVVAIRHPDGSFVSRPSAMTILQAGDVLISLGTPEQHATLNDWTGQGG